MIDPATGIVDINDDLLIDPTGATGVFRPYPEGGTWQAEWPSREWRTFGRKPVVDRAGRRLALTVFLHKDRVAMVDLFYYLPGEAETGTWADWSREQEQARQEQHDAILRGDLGAPPYEYDWGRVRSGYDDKGGFSVIVIRYTDAKGEKA